MGARRIAQAVDAVGNDAQRIDVEAGIGLIEDGARLEHQHLQDLVALLLAAGKPSFTPRDGKLSSMCIWRALPRTTSRKS
jgi:hypothetical protein